ncbi:MAG TPA: hypothetical protein ENJ82_17345, partial [Bacteroidetes bacterium]|nr:hypothetical protein [Bacteroidota bacterium]
MKIKPKIKTISRDYSQKTISYLWEERKTKPLATPEFEHLLVGETKLEHILEIIENAREQLVIYSAQIGSLEVLKALSAAAARGVRLYILCDSKIDAQVHEFRQLAGHSLIRLSKALAGSLVIADCEKGIFLNDKFENRFQYLANLALQLDKVQIETMHYWFCHCFWEGAESQIMEERQFAQPVKVSDSPFGAIPLTAPHLHPEKLPNWLLDQVLGTTRVDAGLSNLRGEGQIPLDALIADHTGQLLTAFQGNDLALLEELADSEMEVRSLAVGKLLIASYLLLEDGGTWLLPERNLDMEAIGYLLPLNADQAQELGQYHAAQISAAPFCLHKTRTYAEIEGAFWPLEDFDGNAPQEISSQVLDPQKNIISLEELHEPDWEKWLEEKEILACKVKYEVELLPKKVPEQAKRDKLYTNWEKNQEKFVEKLAGIVGLIDELEKKKGNIIGRAASFWGGFFTGKAKALGEKKEQVEAWEKLDISMMGRKKAEKIFVEVNEMIQQLSKDAREIDKKVEEGKQKAIFEEKQEALREKEEALNADIAALEDKVEHEPGYYLLKKEELAQNVQSQRQGLVAAYFPEKISGDEPNHDPKLLREIGLKITLEDWKGGKQSITELLGKLKKQKEKRKPELLKSILRKMEDIDRAVGKFEREWEKQKGSNEKELKQKKEKLQKVKEALKEEFRLEDSKSPGSNLAKMNKGGAKMNQKANSGGLGGLHIQDLPSEELPTVGALYALGKERFLGIESWGDFETGKKLAQQLGAELVNL